MKKVFGPISVLSLLLAGWAIQHFGSTADLDKVVTRQASMAEDLTSDAAQRHKAGGPQHWSAMILHRN